MTQDIRQRDRRMSVFYGCQAILLGWVVVIVYLVRGDDAWAPVFLIGASFTLGAFFLIRAFRL